MCNIFDNVNFNAMAQKSYYILMADIISSREGNQHQLMTDFKKITTVIKRKYGKKFLSPITITLGDEFQSVLANLDDAIHIIIETEELMIRKEISFKLRYTLTEGKIDTPINHKTGYGMMGEGLTRARENLTALKELKKRFYISVKNVNLSSTLNNCFDLYQHFLDSWNLKKDAKLITTLFDLKDYKTAADLLQKDRSLIWKRKKNLRIDLYFSLKQIIYYTAAK